MLLIAQRACCNFYDKANYLLGEAKKEKMPRPGREFETLVARIEEKLCPLGASVTSPDRIRDRVTGQLREVDASIRYKLGSAPILITIECRDRGATQDITWLEQIKSKKESIGANQTIAVAKEGFSKPAKVYANQHGIILRQLEEVTDSFILQCMQGLKVFTREIRCPMRNYNVGFYPLPQDEGLQQLSLTDAVHKAIEENRPFTNNRAGEAITLEQLYRELLPEAKNYILQSVDDDGFDSEEMIQGDAEFEAHFAADDLAVETIRGTRYISVIIFGIHYEIKNEAMAPLAPMRYTDEKGQVIDSFSTTTDQNKSMRVNLKLGWDENSSF